MGRPRRRWVDNIRMDPQEVGWGYMDWIGLAQDRDGWRRLVSAVMKLRVPWNAGNFLTSCKPVSFSRRTLHHGVSKWNLLLQYFCISRNLLVALRYILYILRFVLVYGWLDLDFTHVKTCDYLLPKDLLRQIILMYQLMPPLKVHTVLKRIQHLSYRHW